MSSLRIAKTPVLLLGLCLVLITPIGLASGVAGAGRFYTQLPHQAPSRDLQPPRQLPLRVPSPSPTPLPTTRASFTIQWPERGRALVSSAAALSAKITVAAGSRSTNSNRSIERTAPAGVLAQTYQSAAEHRFAVEAYTGSQYSSYSDANATGSRGRRGKCHSDACKPMALGLDTLTLVGAKIVFT